jgi:hypothetical protein
MIPFIREVLLNEPQGRPNSLVQLGSSLCLSCLFVYYWTVGSAGEVLFVLFLVVGSALSGIAESLPENRRRVAGVLRLIALLVLVSSIVFLIITPELIIN